MSTINTKCANMRLAADLEKWIVSATREAGGSKYEEPDSTDYWDGIKLWDVEHAIEGVEQGVDVLLSPDQPGIGVIERLKRIGYPSRTTYCAKTDMGERNMTQVKRDLKDTMDHNEYNKRWVIRHEYWLKRHEKFISKLEGDCKSVYDNMTVENRQCYERMFGFQKTNFVVDLITKQLFHSIDEDFLNKTKISLLQTKMRENQIAKEMNQMTMEFIRLQTRRF